MTANSQMNYLNILKQFIFPFYNTLTVSVLSFGPKPKCKFLEQGVFSVPNVHEVCLVLKQVRVYLFSHNIYEDQSPDVLDKMIELHVEKVELASESFHSSPYCFDILNKKYLRIDNFEHCNFYNIRPVKSSKVGEFRQFVIDNNLAEPDEEGKIPEIFKNHYSLFIENKNICECHIKDIMELMDEPHNFQDLDLRSCSQVEVEFNVWGAVSRHEEIYQKLSDISRSTNLCLNMNFKKKAKEKNLNFLLKVLKEIEIKDFEFNETCYANKANSPNSKIVKICDQITTLLMQDTSNIKNVSSSWGQNSLKSYAWVFGKDKNECVSNFLKFNICGLQSFYLNQNNSCNLFVDPEES